ncbi:MULTISPECIES: hypothetical protein [unclassified Novosphingobium]|uniref:hypothetical protein n=1 Tax=unclassified Novosphingobium TaxID=2644732 RepID=UPI0006C8AC0A|nr:MULTISPECIES: hypothetical protein [unclassified Novosphingobium]KPH66979.1 hypothetical protein ADT71_03415 [Novosphingobium sp. ST904]MPS71387.1 hypothetical protein [Novosphingobium sp.]TCM28127.1 hypothetical protein EDF59_13036 [Novosphingobium sp. ST904]
MTHPLQTPIPNGDNDGTKLLLWPDGTWCWHEDYRPCDYTHVSDEFEVIDLSGMPAVKRTAGNFPDVFTDAGEHMGGSRPVRSAEA